MPSLTALDKKAVAAQKAKSSGWAKLRNLTAEREEMVADERLTNVLEKVQSETRCESVLLIPLHSLTEEESFQMRCLGTLTSRWRSQDPKGGSHPDWSLREGSPASLCIQTKQPVVVDNIFSDKRHFSRSGLDFGSISQLCAPIFSPDGSDITGVLKLLNKVRCPRPPSS